ncbi:MAG: DNA primase [Deltaproteobacteria bacterium]|nr:MAG: DNA primase [Deltaproteobacteria bacterium]
MARNFDPVIQQIRERSDIVQVIGRHVKLQRSGSSFKACCPFHQEKTPSFHVHPDKQFYYCFGCGAKGDAFSFLMQYEGKTFPEAVEVLADEYNIEIPTVVGEDWTKVSEAAEKKEKCYQLNQWAKAFFIDRLQSEEGREARTYLEQRGISQEMIETFGLGYAPDDWGRLVSHLKEKGADIELACEIGLLKQAEASDRIYDKYRHRLMFPIVEPSGRLAGFGGRVLRSSDGAKYLNSPDSLIFHKSKLLYGLNLARKAIRQNEGAILVEGYLDVIGMHQFGFSQAVAALGTALNQDHLTTIKRYTKQVTLLFDADEAGVKAAGRGLQVLVPGGISVNIGTLPEGEDPDSFLQSRGRQAMEQLLDKDAKPGLEFWIHHLKDKADNDPVQLREVTHRVLELLQGIPDPILQNFYVKRTSELLGVEEAQLRRGFFRVVKKSEAATQRTPEPVDMAPIMETKLTVEHRTLAKLIKIVIENPDLFSYVAQAEMITKLPTPSLSQLWEQFIHDLQEGADAAFLSEMVLGDLNAEPTFRRLLAQMLLKDPRFDEEDVEDEWERLMFTLNRLTLETELQRVQTEIKQAQQINDVELWAALSADKQKLQMQLQKVLASFRGKPLLPSIPGKEPESEAPFAGG